MINRDTNVQKSDNKPENVVIIRGGGDLASGTIHRLYRCGYRLLVLECEKPTAIRRIGFFLRGCFMTGSLLWKEFSAEKLTV